jgi:hypothetical protein
MPTNFYLTFTGITLEDSTFNLFTVPARWRFIPGMLKIMSLLFLETRNRIYFNTFPNTPST